MQRWNDARTSLFEGHANVKKGDAYEGHSPHCSRAASCDFRPRCGKAESVLPEESYSRQLRRSRDGEAGATKRPERQCEELRPDAAGRAYSSKRESHRRSKVDGRDAAGRPECQARLITKKCQKCRGHSSIAISQLIWSPTIRRISQNTRKPQRAPMRLGSTRKGISRSCRSTWKPRGR